MSPEVLKILLDFAFVNAFLVQIFYEFIPLHPVDERTGVSAVTEVRPARQVDGTSCGRPDKHTKKDMNSCPITRSEAS